MLLTTFTPDPTQGGDRSPSEGLGLPPLDGLFAFDPERPLDTSEILALLQESAERFYRVFSVSPACISVARLDTHELTHVNDGFVDLFGYTREELLEKRLDDLDLYVVVSDFTYLFEQLRKRGALRRVNQRMRRRDGEIREVLASYVVIEINGVQAVVSKLVDVTDIRRLEEAVFRAQDQARLQIAQDLHDGLGSLIAGTAYQSHALTEALAETSPEHASAAAHLTELLQQAQTAVRNLAYQLAPFEIEENRLAEALALLAAHVTDTSDLTCRFDGEDIVLPSTAVSTHLYRIAQEAVQNAIRHSGCSEVFLGLSALEGRFRLIIADNGSGLPDADWLDRHEESSGVGLFSMHNRARSIGAVLDLADRPGGGTVVTCAEQEHPEREEI